MVAPGNRPSRLRVAVVGAGIAGLSCARELQREGVHVEVFERDEDVGGRMCTRIREGHAFDVGANFLVGAYRALNTIAAEHGIAIRTVSPVAHVVLRGGIFHRLNFSGITDVFRMGGLHAEARLRFIGLVLKVRTHWPHLDFFDLCSVPDTLNDEDAWSFVAREGGEELADYVFDAFHSCMMFSRLRESSAAALVSLLSMMSSPGLDFSIQYAAGDMIAIPAALATHLTVHTGCSVDRVSPSSESGWHVETSGGADYFDQVVVATTAGPALQLLNGAPAHRALVAATRFACTINVSFRVPRGSLGRVHCFYVPFVENPIISEFTNEGLKEDLEEGDGEVLVNVGLHEQAALALMDAPDSVIFDTVRKTLLDLCEPLRAVAHRVIPHDLQRWPEAIPKYDAAHIRRVREFQESGQGERGLWLCGDYLNAPWTEGACRNGQATAQSLLHATGWGRESQI